MYSAGDRQFSVTLEEGSSAADYVADVADVSPMRVGRRKFDKGIFDARCPIPNSQFPIPNSQFPLPDAQFPIPNSQFPILNL